MWKQLADAPVDAGLTVDVGPEKIGLTDGLQPLMFRTAAGTLCLQAGTLPPAGWGMARKDPWPPLAMVLCRDNGETWRRMQLKPDQGGGPVVMGGECASG